MISRRTALIVPFALGMAPAIGRAAALKPRGGDQSQPLQAAIDAAQISGDVLTLGAGTFTVADLRVIGDITISGVPGRTV